MSRSLIISIAVVIGLMVLGGGGYFLMNRSAKSPEPLVQQNTPTSQSSSTESMQKISLKSLMRVGQNQKCEFSDPETNNSGTVLMANGKFRGDFSSSVNDKVTSSHMISDSKDIYIWIEGMTDGFKTSIETMEKNQATGEQQTIDVNKEIDYKCEGWNPDQSVFQIPTSIKFADMSKLMEQTSAKINASGSTKLTIPKGNTEVCAACDNLTGTAKTQCKAALKCE